MFSLEKSKKLQLLFSVFIALLVIIPIFSNKAQAAKLSISPSEKTVNRSEVVYLNVYADSEDETVNAFSGNLAFDNDAVEVLGVTTTGSVIDIWSVAPSIQANEIVFEGVITETGYHGDAALLFSFSVRVNDYGTYQGNLHNTQVLAHDGYATPVNVRTGSVALTVAPVGTRIAQVEKEVECYRPEAPDITVANKQDGWYTHDSLTLAWEVDGTESAAYLGFDQHENGGDVSLSSITDNWTIPLQESGRWYAHIALENDCGMGDIATLPFDIDIHPPVADLATVTYMGTDLHDDGRWTGLMNVHVNGWDQGSGIKSYSLLTVKGEIEPIVVDEDGAIWEGFYSQWLEQGDPIYVRIEDEAGNVFEKELRPTPAQLDISPFRYAVQSGYLIISKWILIFALVGLVFLIAMISLWLDWRQSRKA